MFEVVVVGLIDFVGVDGSVIAGFVDVVKKFLPGRYHLEPS